MPPVAGYSTAGRFLGLRTFAVPQVWLMSSATKAARQLSTRLECVGKLLELICPSSPRRVAITALREAVGLDASGRAAA